MQPGLINCAIYSVKEAGAPNGVTYAKHHQDLIPKVVLASPRSETF